jgi:osmotically-inducible protein OsmY
VPRVKGVKAVAQALEVRLPSDRKTTDEEIAARAVKILSWAALVARDPHHRQGRARRRHLAWEVAWQFQRTEADDDVHKLGVKAVVNDITVAAKVHPEDVHAMICAALERHAEIEAGNTRGQRRRRQGHVERQGERRTEREAIEHAARSAPGVTQVDDKLELVRP